MCKPSIGVGLCLAAFGGRPLHEVLEAAHEIGVTSVDLPTDTTLDQADVVRLASDAGYRANVLRTLRAAPVPVSCVSNSRDTQLLLGPHGPHTDPVHAGSADQKRAHGLLAALETIRFAEELGVRHVRLMLGCPDHARWLSWWGSTVSWSDNVATWLAAATSILDAAAAAGITLLIEPHPKQVAFDRVTTEELLDATSGWPGVARLCGDPANLAAIGHNPHDAIRGWGDRLAAVHVKDLQRWTGMGGAPEGPGWCRYGPQPHIRFRTLGFGELPWPSLVASLLDERFHGIIYLEHEDTLLPRRQGIAHAAKHLRAMLPVDEPEGRTW